MNSSTTFSEWLAKQIQAEYGKSSTIRWTEDDTNARINALTNVALLDYFAMYQRALRDYT